MQTLDIAEDTAMVLDDDTMEYCCAAYRLLNSTLFSILAKPGVVDPYLTMLDGINDIISVQTNAIYHISIDAPQANLIASIGDISSFTPTIEKFARSIIEAPEQPLLWYSDKKYPDLLIRAAQVNTELTQEYVFLVLICNNAQNVGETQSKVVEVLAQGFADVFSATRHAQVNRRRALQEERATISRELHDSLAQSLTYLKIQASRIESILKHEQSTDQYDRAEAEMVVQELRQNLNVAYRQLRELMTTFRLTMNGENLNQAIEETIAEFAKRTSIVFELDNRLGNDELTTDEEMQILHIVREALSNIVRHSHAHRARVAFRHKGKDNVEISIDDDGVGIDETQRRAQHHGLVIMQERSQNLGGEFDVHELDSGGTKLTITFRAQKALKSSQQRHLK